MHTKINYKLNPLVENITKEIIGLRMEDAMDPGTFRDILYKMIHKRRPLVRNTHEARNIWIVCADCKISGFRLNIKYKFEISQTLLSYVFLIIHNAPVYRL